MRASNTFRRNYAVSEVIGGLLLITIAVFSFSIIYLYMFPPGPDYDTSVKIEGYITDDGIVTLKHVGGNPLDNYKVVVRDPNGTYIGSKIEKNWYFGEYKYPLDNITDIKLTDENVKVKISIYSLNKDGKEQEVFTWEPSGKFNEILEGCPILISSLRTNTPDEDLICYSYPVLPNINATSYVYNWILNGASITDLNVPFDIENNNTCKDYSGRGLNGTLVGANWSNNGVIGGATYYRGSKDYITFDLPPVFNDIPNNDFSISIWINTLDVNSDHSVILMASKNTRNFIKIFLYGSELHFGICHDGIKDAVRTESLSNNTWYHIAGVWDSDKNLLLVYCNGIEYDLPGYRNFAVGSQTDVLEIGHGTASSNFWNGYMDQLVVYKKMLSLNQIYQIYISEKAGDYSRRVLVSEETSIGNIWKCIVTPNDGKQDDAPICSNSLKIISYSGGD